MACLLGILAVACGGGSEGRDPVLGNDGNVALAPTVTAVSPAAGATGVAVDIAAITATFSEPMEAITGDASFTADLRGTVHVARPGATTLDAAGTTASFTLDGRSSTRRPIRRTIAGARSEATGLALEEPFTWTFTTIAPPPTVTAVAPVDDATGVPVNNTVITAQFSEPVDALADGDFTVTCEAPCTERQRHPQHGQHGHHRHVRRSPARPRSRIVTATPPPMVSATSSATGQDLQAPFVWSFTTGVTPDTTRPRVIAHGTADHGPGSDDWACPPTRPSPRHSAKTWTR
ncbi:MAG: Ig-like domain-containing protein [Gammaproteobacteria bacterium]|nr:Ig-like domain-containing protein [Gammaproteobacteria bacterium]